jgi:hypothetical protein
MRTPKELESVQFADWSSVEIAEAAITGRFPLDASVRLGNLARVLPRLDKIYQEEHKAFEEVQRASPRNAYTKEWKKELEEMADIITRGITLGTQSNLWHSAGAKCSKCDAVLVRMEVTLCTSCKHGATPMNR